MKDKGQIPLRTSSGLNWENKTYLGLLINWQVSKRSSLEGDWYIVILVNFYLHWIKGFAFASQVLRIKVNCYTNNLIRRYCWFADDVNVTAILVDKHLSVSLYQELKWLFRYILRENWIVLPTNMASLSCDCKPTMYGMIKWIFQQICFNSWGVQR